MKRLCLAVMLAALTTAASAQAGPWWTQSPQWGIRPPGVCGAAPWRCYGPPPLAYAPDAPPPLGWLFGRYTVCLDPPGCASVVVSVGVDGLNVRMAPNGPVVLALANGVPVVPLRQEGDWLLVAAACPLVPTFTWAITAGGIPLSVCL